jgi:hypothetical protein
MTRVYEKNPAASARKMPSAQLTSAMMVIRPDRLLHPRNLNFTLLASPVRTSAIRLRHAIAP